jgi:CBS domain-containing protein
MTVRAILALKGHDVATILPRATLADAARLLSEKRIGAVVVAGPSQTVAGILSERDIVRALSKHGAGALAQTVESVMTREVVTCAPEETIPDLMQRMTAGRFRHVPVLEHGRLAGIVSVGDVVKHRLEEMERESQALKAYIATA